MRMGLLDPAMSEDHDAHVRQAKKLFRDCGFDIGAMRYKRPPEALSALKRFNGLPDTWAEPVAWRYFPNAYMRDNWRQLYGDERSSEAVRPLSKQENGVIAGIFIHDWKLPTFRKKLTDAGHIYKEERNLMTGVALLSLETEDSLALFKVIKDCQHACRQQEDELNDGGPQDERCI